MSIDTTSKKCKEKLKRRDILDSLQDDCPYKKYTWLVSVWVFNKKLISDVHHSERILVNGCIKLLIISHIRKIEEMGI